ncbi:MAG: hypothetical protein AB9866_15160 [Syntrophobacteraceae bacterium]
MKSLFSRLLKAFPWGLTILLAILCVSLLYGVVNQSVTLDHRNQQCSLIKKQRDFLWYFAGTLAKGTSKAEFLNLIEQHSVEYFSKGDDQIIADQLGFRFENNRLVRIETCEALEACQ